MTRQRKISTERGDGHHGRGPNGRRLCRWCGTEVPPRRQTFCSNDCVHEWRIRSDPGYVRECLEKRDHGICSICGVDTKPIAAYLRGLQRKCWGLRSVEERTEAFRELETILEMFGLRRKVVRCASTERIIQADATSRDRSRDGLRVLIKRAIQVPAIWEAHHRVAVTEGGGLCGLDGFQTACVFCHRNLTADLHRRRRRTCRPLRPPPSIPEDG